MQDDRPYLEGRFLESHHRRLARSDGLEQRSGLGQDAVKTRAALGKHPADLRGPEPRLTLSVIMDTMSPKYPHRPRRSGAGPTQSGKLQMHRTAMLGADALRDGQSRFIAVDGMQVHFKREGRGPTIVLLHGSGSSLHCFDQVVPPLTSTYEVVRLDLPGFGLTGPRPDRDYRIETYVSFLERFVAALAIGRFSIAGNSLGGNIAWNFALDYPEKVQGLILMNATGYPEKSLPAAMRLVRNPLARAVLRRWIPRGATARNLRNAIGSRMPQVEESLIDRVHALTNRPGNRQAFIDLANTSQRDRSAEIRRIKVPTLVLRGDSIDGQHFARDIAGSRELVYEGIGHLLPDEAPFEVATAISDHLGRLTNLQ